VRAGCTRGEERLYLTTLRTAVSWVVTIHHGGVRTEKILRTQGGDEKGKGGGEGGDHVSAAKKGRSFMRRTRKNGLRFIRCTGAKELQAEGRSRSVGEERGNL